MSNVRTSPTKMIKIDGDRLYSQLKERGLSPATVAKEVGVHPGYFSNVKHRGSMSNMMAVLLESRFGIPKDTYVLKPEPETTVVEVVTDKDFFAEENQRKLYKIVYSAVYNAMRRALNE